VRPMSAASKPVRGIHAGDGEGAWFQDDRKAIAAGSVTASATGLKPPLATLEAVSAANRLLRALPGAWIA
jgi:hypothetical protein